MNWMAADAIVLGGGNVLLAAVVLRWLLNRDADAGAPAAEKFSLARYQIMMRLTSEEDFEFLAALPGYRQEIGERLRRDRRRIFQMYLRALAVDFRVLHAAARKLAAAAPERHAGLVSALIGCQLTFWRRMALVEFRLLTSRARFPNLDIAPLLQPMEFIRLQLANA
jgi:hypothetical protein